MLFYQGSFLSHKKNDSSNTINNFDEFLSNEQISIFEKFCFYTDNLYKILQNKIRRKVNLISLKNPIKDNTININNKNGIKNNILSDEYFKLFGFAYTLYSKERKINYTYFKF
jgi:hypothetical protein